MSEASRPRVVGLGLCVVDHLYEVDDFGLRQERTRYAARVESAGGMVATALVQAALLGCRARLISALGDDAAGRFARRSLRSGGVETRGVVSSEHPATGIAVVLVRRGSGERRFLVADRRRLERRIRPLDVAPVRRADVLLVDTAGRLHVEERLMRQLVKMHEVIARKIPDAPHEVLLVLDATSGQNALQQAKVFSEAVGVTGLFLAKLDGTARGGIVVAIRDVLDVPVKLVGVGESPEDVQPFDPDTFIEAMFEQSIEPEPAGSG